LIRPTLGQGKVGNGKLRQLQGYTLLLCGTLVVWVTLWGSMIALARPAQYARLQVSPLSLLVSPITVTVTNPVTVTIVATPTLAASTIATVTLVNRGQTSVFLVGAVLVGLLVVIILVIWRRR